MMRSILGVNYRHVRLPDGGDLLLTRYGMGVADLFQPENWVAKDWFGSHRRRLRRSSTVYGVKTRCIRGRSLDLVVRSSRVGEAVPLDTATLAEYPHAAFNSPFEEIATLMQLRAARIGAGRRRMLTKRPLAVYVPPARLELWQTGRRWDAMESAEARSPGQGMDIHRQYLLVYGWIDGVDMQEATEGLGVCAEACRELQEVVTAMVTGELAQAGFRVLDMKPAHILVRLNPDGSWVRRPDGRLAYALVDYELLERIPGR